MSLVNAFQCSKRFSEGREVVEDGERLDRFMIARNEGKGQQIKEILQKFAV